LAGEVKAGEVKAGEVKAGEVNADLDSEDARTSVRSTAPP